MPSIPRKQIRDEGMLYRWEAGVWLEAASVARLRRENRRLRAWAMLWALIAAVAVVGMVALLAMARMIVERWA